MWPQIASSLIKSCTFSIIYLPCLTPYRALASSRLSYIILEQHHTLYYVQRACTFSVIFRVRTYLFCPLLNHSLLFEND
jgi:hypothetical protein